jgi:hypothetical protein
MPNGIVRSLSFAALLLVSTTAAASDLCVNYVSEVQSRPKEWAFTSFNPRTKQSAVVAQIRDVPYYVTWQKDFKALTYETSKVFKLEWKVGALPTKLRQKAHTSLYLPKSVQLGKVWDAGSPDLKCDTLGKNDVYFCSITADVPAHREIHPGSVEGDSLHFVAPVTWVNTENGETKSLYEDPAPSGCCAQVQISTADNFILVGTEYEGGDAIVADMGTGEMLLRTGEHSTAAGWGKCPSK